MKRGKFLIGFLLLLYALLPLLGYSNGMGDSITWSGSSKNWRFEIKLIHTPNAKMITHARVRPCPNSDYIIEVSQGLTYIGNEGNQITSFKAIYNNFPRFLGGFPNEMTIGEPKGLKPLPYGTRSTKCFTKEQWNQIKFDQSNTMAVTIIANPLDTRGETITLKTAKGF